MAFCKRAESKLLSFCISFLFLYLSSVRQLFICEFKAELAISNYLFLAMWYSHEILVPKPGIEPRTTAVKVLITNALLDCQGIPLAIPIRLSRTNTSEELHQRESLVSAREPRVCHVA